MKARFVLLFAAASLLVCSGSQAAEKVLFQVRLFYAPSLNLESRQPPAAVLSAASYPQLAALKDRAAGSGAEFSAAVMDSLMEIFDLEAVEDLFLLEKEWDGRSGAALDGRVWGASAGFRVNILPRSLPSGRVSIRLDINKTAAIMKASRDPWSKLENIVGRELEIGLDEPVVIAASHREGTYFIAVLASRGRTPEITGPAPQNKIEIVAAPSAVKRVRPSYPDRLRLLGIGGEVGMQVTIDAGGDVLRVDVIAPRHPYLNFTAVQALLQWKFEPVLRKGKPVPAAFRCSWTFDPAAPAPELQPAVTGPQEEGFARLSALPASGASFPQAALPALLEKGGEYCRRLTGAILDFVCDEKIDETRYSLLKNIQWNVLMLTPKPRRIGAGTYYDISEHNKPSEQMQFSDASQSRFDNLVADTGQAVKPKVELFQIMDPKQTRRSNLLCDYQIVKKAGTATERRIILKENGRKSPDRSRQLDEKRFSELSALFSPLRIMAPDRQPRFDFVILGEDKVRGRKAYIVKATPRSGDEDGIWSARVWLEQTGGRVLKCEIEGVPIEGHDDVLEDSVVLNIRPSFVVTHEYRVEKNGVLFPDRSSIQVGYPGVDPRGPIPKTAAKFSYEKYKFFSVETDEQIKTHSRR